MFNRLKSTFSAVLLGALTRVFGWYEGGRRGSIERSYVPEFMRDARVDIGTMERWELQRKSRYFEKNNSIYNKIVDLFELYVVGTGLVITPASSNPEWNQKAAKEWAAWCKWCNIAGRQSFAQLQSLIARAWFVDGECFVILMTGQRNTPRLQVIEAHRVGTPSNTEPISGNAIYDGVEVEKLTGRPVAYYVQTDSDQGEFTRVPADRVVHIFEQSRAGQYRGIPFVHPCLCDLHDMDDLQIMEMKASKDAAEITNVIKNSTGELPSVSDLRRARFSITGQKADGTTTTEDRAEYVQRRVGGRTIALKTGEDFAQFKSERPSVTTQWYWDYLTAKVCCGVGISKMLVMPWSIQGTVARGIFDQDAAFFNARWSSLIEHFGRIYEHWARWAKSNVEGLYDPPADFWAWRSRPPRAVNVDVGRNSTATLAELAAGLTTLEAEYAALGKDWREQTVQRADELAFIRQCAEERGITPGEIASSVADAISKQAVAKAKEEAAEKPEEPEAHEPEDKKEKAEA